RRSSTTTSSGARRKRCRSTAASASSIGRTGGRCAEGASGVAGAAAAPIWPSRRGLLAGALRGHQRLRAPPRPDGNEDREVLPPGVEGDAEEAGQIGRASG